MSRYLILKVLVPAIRFYNDRYESDTGDTEEVVFKHNDLLLKHDV